MRVLFVEADTESHWSVAALGAGFLAAYLRRHGHEADFLRVPFDADASVILDRIAATGPGLLGFSLTTRQWLRVRALVRQVDAVSDIPIICGGLHPTFSPEDVLAEPGVDYVCLGEGEAALLDLVTALESGGPDEGIDNIWKRGGARPKLRPPIEPIDSLPFIARDMLDERWSVAHVTTQRGCPFPCTYCAARMYDQLYGEDDSRYGRRRSHENVLAELEEIRAAGKLAYVIFLDDTFTIHHPWVHAYCKLHKERIGVPFSVHARVETVDERLIESLAKGGCRHIVYGVESGSERVRREIMRRHGSNKRIKEVFRATKEAGIMATANYILGIPGETRADLEATIALHRELEPADFGFFVFYPYPGTPLFQVCHDKGYLPADWRERPANHRETILDLPGLSKADIAEFYRRWTELRVATVAQRPGVGETAARASVEAVAHVG